MAGTIALTPFHVSRHLGEDELLEPGHVCPVCLSNGVRQKVGVLQEDPSVDLLVCTRCRAASADRMPSEEALASYYGGYYEAYAPDEHTTFHDTGRFAQHILKHVPSEAFAPTTRLLDFGGGDGSVAVKLAELLVATGRSNFVEIMLVDPTADKALSTKNCELSYRSDLDNVEPGFQLVLASAVLEHIPRVNGVIHELFDLLVDGGAFYARTPYAAPLKRILPRFDLTFPAHVHDMGVDFWDRVPETLGLDARVVRSAPSIVETSFRASPIRAFAAQLLKAPAFAELLLKGKTRRSLRWHWVGGWEVVLQRGL